MKPYLQKNKFVFSLFCFISIITGAIEAFGWLFLAIILEKLINKQINLFFIYLGIEFLILFTYIAFNILNSFVKSKMVFKMTAQLQNKIGRKISLYSLLEYEKNDQGNYFSWLNNDADIVENNYFDAFFEIINISISTILIIFGIIYFNYIISILFICFLIISILASFLQKKYLQKKTKNYSEANELFNHKLSKNFQHYAHYLFSNKINNWNIQWKENNKLMKKEDTKFKDAYNLIKTWNYFIAISLLILSFIIAGILFMNGLIIAGFLSSLIAIIPNLTRKNMQIFNYFSSFKSTKILIKKYEDKNFTLKEVNLDPIKFNSLTIKNLTYKYNENQKNIIEDFNYTFVAKNKYAIIAPSGKGKSTLIKLIAGIYRNYSGEIFINDLNIKDLNHFAINNYFAFASAKTYILDDSIKENICFFDDYEIKKINDILNKSKIDFIENINSNNINNFSDGQKQRINLARELIKPKKILILDEALSNIDKINSENILNDLLNDQELTLIYISHHINEELLKKFNDKIFL